MAMKRAIAIILTAVMVFAMFPGFVGLEAAHAANGSGKLATAAVGNTIGKLNGKGYSSLERLASDLESNYKNGKVTIEMTANWNAVGKSDFDRRLIIPEGCTASFLMHGYVFNRNRAFRNDSKWNGELICLESKSKLTITGAFNEPEKSISHPLVATYASTSRDKKASKSITTYGGTLTGGCSPNGAGGIHVKDHCTLTLNDVTIAGCSTRDGGFTNGFGGGICVWYGDSSISGLEISHNTAKKYGGGIHCDSTGISLSSLVVTKNMCERGAGVFIHKDGNTISSCTITENGNLNTVSGGGVYVDSGVDANFSVTGATVVKDNKCANSSGKNFYFSDNTPTNNRANFSLTKGADVRVSYWATQDRDSIMVTNGKVNDTIKSTNCIQFLTAENPGYHFTFNAEPNQRKIYYVRNGRDSAATGNPVGNVQNNPVDVNPGDAINNPGDRGGYNETTAGIVGTVGAGGGSGSDYNLIRGFTRHDG